MCISWYDMTLSCSVPPTSTWCHSGGRYELTVPVYNQEANIRVVLYAHAYLLDFSTHRPFTPFQLSWYLFIMTIDTSLLCNCVRSVKVHCTTVGIDITSVLYQPSAHMCEGCCSCRLCVSCLHLQPCLHLQQRVVSKWIYTCVKTILMAPICVSLTMKHTKHTHMCMHVTYVQIV